jgi:hypothetical protein
MLPEVRSRSYVPRRCDDGDMFLPETANIIVLEFPAGLSVSKPLEADMRHPTLFQQMRQLRRAIAANARELHTLRSAIHIRRTAADHDASLAAQLAEAAEMLESAELNLRTLPGYRDRRLKLRGSEPRAHSSPPQA